MEDKMCECGDLPAEDCMCDAFEIEEEDLGFWHGRGLIKAFGGSDPD